MGSGVGLHGITSSSASFKCVTLDRTSSLQGSLYPTGGLPATKAQGREPGTKLAPTKNQLPLPGARDTKNRDSSGVGKC